MSKIMFGHSDLICIVTMEDFSQRPGPGEGGKGGRGEVAVEEVVVEGVAVRDVGRSSKFVSSGGGVTRAVAHGCAHVTG
jgi:hypothetical protein